MTEILNNNRRSSGQSNGNELEIKIESKSSNFLPTDPAIKLQDLITGLHQKEATKCYERLTSVSSVNFSL